MVVVNELFLRRATQRAIEREEREHKYRAKDPAKNKYLHSEIAIIIHHTDCGIGIGGSTKCRHNFDDGKGRSDDERHDPEREHRKAGKF